MNSIHSACAAAFARHRGKTGTLHLLQEEIFRLDKAIDSVIYIQMSNQRMLMCTFIYFVFFWQIFFSPFSRNTRLSQDFIFHFSLFSCNCKRVLESLIFKRFLDFYGTVIFYSIFHAMFMTFFIALSKESSMRGITSIYLSKVLTGPLI